VTSNQTKPNSSVDVGGKQKDKTCKAQSVLKITKHDWKVLQTLFVANARKYGRLGAAWGVASAQVDELWRENGWKEED
jgi:hypothetical protein